MHLKIDDLFTHWSILIALNELHLIGLNYFKCLILLFSLKMPVIIAAINIHIDFQ